MNFEKSDEKKNNGMTIIVLKDQPQKETVDRYQDFIDRHFDYVGDTGQQKFVNDILKSQGNLLFDGRYNFKKGRRSVIVVLKEENTNRLKYFSNYSFYHGLGLSMFSTDLIGLDSFVTYDEVKLLSVDPELMPTPLDVAVVRLITSKKARYLSHDVDFVEAMLP